LNSIKRNRNEDNNDNLLDSEVLEVDEEWAESDVKKAADRSSAEVYEEASGEIEELENQKSTDKKGLRNVTTGDKVQSMREWTDIPDNVDIALRDEGADEWRGGRVRPTILHLGPTWETVESVASRAVSKDRDRCGESRQTLGRKEQECLRQQSYDILDALTRSGEMVVFDSELHLIHVTAHCLEDSVIESVLCRNVDPAETSLKCIRGIAKGIGFQN
tara:strand:+ start:72 stop:725 length:654 start_codon:yes stop_codon:yes gene_type:complete